MSKQQKVDKSGKAQKRSRTASTESNKTLTTNESPNMDIDDVVPASSSETGLTRPFTLLDLQSAISGAFEKVLQQEGTSKKNDFGDPNKDTKRRKTKQPTTFVADRDVERRQVSAAAGNILAILDTLSLRQRRDVLTMVGSLSSLRVLPVDRPLVPLATKAPAAPSSKKEAKPQSTGSSAPVQRQAPTAAWRTDPVMRDLAAQRTTLLGEVKACQPGLQKESLLARLRDIERQLKERRQSLKQQQQQRPQSGDQGQ